MAGKPTRAGKGRAPRRIAWRPTPAMQALLDSLTTIIAILDRDGVIRMVNRAWREFAINNALKKDYLNESYLKVCDEAKGPWSDEAPAAAAGIRAVILGRMRLFALEYPCHAPSMRRWYLMRVSLIEDVPPLRVLVAHDEITPRRLAEEALEQTNACLATVREEERRHLARELHDNIGQRIFGLNMMLHNILSNHEVQAVPATRDALAKLVEGCDEVIRDVRELSQALYPQSLETMGLIAAMERLVSEFRRHANVTLTYPKRLRTVRFDRSVEISLFRICQEAVNNAVRHSQARQIRVTIRCAESKVELSVVDNGVGFEPQKIKHGLGLRTMQERAKAVGGNLRVSSRPGRTEVAVSVRNP